METWEQIKSQLRLLDKELTFGHYESAKYSLIWILFQSANKDLSLEEMLEKLTNQLQKDIEQ